MRVLVSHTAEQIVRGMRPSARSGRNHIRVLVATANYHSAVTPDSYSSSEDSLDAQQWGYRVVSPVSSSRIGASSAAKKTVSGRPFSSLTSYQQHEDYDYHSQHDFASQSTHCDLGAILGGTDAVLEFDEAGMIRPVWETAGMPTMEDTTVGNDQVDAEDSTIGTVDSARIHLNVEDLTVPKDDDGV